MKRGLLLLCLLLSSFGSVFAQDKMQISLYPYMLSDVGQVSALNINYPVHKQWNVYGGIKFLHNLGDLPDSRGYLLHHRFHADNRFQHIGYSAGVQYALPDFTKYLKLFAYYDFTYFHTGTAAHQHEYIEQLPDLVSTVYVVVVRRYHFNNVNSFEQNVGVGFTSKIAGPVYLISRGGIGVNFISHLPKAHFPSGSVAQISLQLGVGFGISL